MLYIKVILIFKLMSNIYVFITFKKLYINLNIKKKMYITQANTTVVYLSVLSLFVNFILMNNILFWVFNNLIY